MIDLARLTAAYQAARRDLLAERTGDGHWVGRLSSSAPSTATAVAALATVARHTTDDARRNACRQLIARGVEYLVRCQNSDGGWSDTDKSRSNIAAAMLARSAFHIAEITEHHQELLARADDYIDTEGDINALKQRYGSDRTFVVPILATCAMAGIVPWRDVPPLPFELACLPYAVLRFLRLPVAGYSVPALVAVGQARFFHRRPRCPIAWTIRRLCVGRSLKILEQMQHPGGGFLEAVPPTSFVVMSLAGTGRADHPVVRNGVKFLLGSIREDGSWPIEVNLATRNTAGAINALAASTGNVGVLGCLDWLLSRQCREPHPFTHDAPGGWPRSDLSGATPDVDDTAGVLLALTVLFRSGSMNARQQIQAAAAEGLKWLLDLQNADGGWPTFCRDCGTMPLNRSGTDLTAHALRAIGAWQELSDEDRVAKAIGRGFDYLARQQRNDGSWTPLWFGNQRHTTDENPIYGTAWVLTAYRDFDRIADDPAQRGLQYLAASRSSGIEETAVAIDALLANCENPSIQAVAEDGLVRLIEAVESGRHREAAPIGLYFAKLWYYEDMYPLTLTVAALGQAVRRLTI